MEQNKGKEVYIKLFQKNENGKKEYRGILEDFNEKTILLEKNIEIERRNIAQIKTIYHW